MPSNSQNKITTTGDSSPAVIAKSFSATYGVRSEAIIEILSVYEQEGLDLSSRREVTEEILKKYNKVPERENNETKLSDATIDKLGIQKKPKILDALEWDLFSNTNHLLTNGDYSPAVSSSGDVFIWYGIPPETLRALAKRLEDNNVTIENFESQLRASAKDFKKLQKQLGFYSEKDKIYDKARKLLEEGKLEEADKLIDTDYHLKRKRDAYKGFVYGLTKELLNNYKEAKKGYKDAIYFDDSNIVYYLKYGEILMRLNESKEAIIWIEKALKLLNESDLNEEENIKQKSNIFNQLGFNYHIIGDFDKAIFYHEKAITFIKESYHEEHPLLGPHYINLGKCWSSKNSLDKSMAFFKKALAVYTKEWGEDSEANAINYYNIGLSFLDMRDGNNAKEYFKKAEKIYLNASPRKGTLLMGMLSYNLGRAYILLSNDDDALACFEQSKDIFSSSSEVSHKFLLRSIVATYETLGIIGVKLRVQGKFKESIGYFNKAYAYAQSVGRNPYSIYCLLNLGKNKIGLNLEDDALKDFNEALDLLSKTAITDEYKKNLESDRGEIIIGKIHCLTKLGRQEELKEFLIELKRTALENN